jgi:hypothetical protein
MSIRKIRANTATVEGEYVHVEEYSQKSMGFFIGFIFGIILVFTINTLGISLDFMAASLLVLISGILGTSAAPGRVSRNIPEVDVVEIKYYPDEERVTVVIDDERTKRKQSVAVSKN